MIDDFRDKLRRNQGLRIFILSAQNLISAFLTAYLTHNVKSSGGFNWTNTTSSPATWLILIYILLLYFFFTKIYAEKNKFDKKREDETFNDYLKREVSPYVAERYRQEILNGNLVNVDDFLSEI